MRGISGYGAAWLVKRFKRLDHAKAAPVFTRWVHCKNSSINTGTARRSPARRGTMESHNSQYLKDLRLNSAIRGSPPLNKIVAKQHLRSAEPPSLPGPVILTRLFFYPRRFANCLNLRADSTASKFHDG